MFVISSLADAVNVIETKIYFHLDYSKMQSIKFLFLARNRRAFGHFDLFVARHIVF